MYAFAELCGPVRFGGWTPDGSPVAVPARAPHVQIAGVTLEQTATTTKMLPEVITARLREEFQIMIGVEKTKATIDGRQAQIQPVTSSSKTQEGARPTAFISNETHLWTSREPKRMSEVIRRNLAKSAGAARELSFTNAHVVGAGSVAEEDDDAAGSAGDVLLDTIYPRLPDGFDFGDEDQIRSALEVGYRSSWWIDLDRIIADVLDPKMSETSARQFFFNIPCAGVDAWLTADMLDACRRDEGRMPKPRAGISLGFDGGKTFDSTAIVATCMETGWQWLAGVWERDDEDPDWSVPVHEVWTTVENLFDTWAVARMYCDPQYWRTQISEWCGRWDQIVMFDFATQERARWGRMTAATRAAIAAGEQTWGGPNADVFRRQMLNGVERPIQGLHSDDGMLHTVSKESRHSPRSVDAAHAAILSWQARLDAQAKGWKKPTVVSLLTRDGRWVS